MPRILRLWLWLRQAGARQAAARGALLIGAVLLVSALMLVWPWLALCSLTLSLAPSFAIQAYYRRWLRRAILACVSSDAVTYPREIMDRLPDLVSRAETRAELEWLLDHGTLERADQGGFARPRPRQDVWFERAREP